MHVKSVLAAMNRSNISAAGSRVAVGTITGTTDRPRGSVNLWASDLVACQEPLGQLTVNASLDNQLVTVDTLHSPSRRTTVPRNISGTGSYALDRHTYTVSLASSDLRLEHAALPGTPIRGRAAERRRQRQHPEAAGRNRRCAPERCDVGTSRTSATLPCMRERKDHRHSLTPERSLQGRRQRANRSKHALSVDGDRDDRRPRPGDAACPDAGSSDRHSARTHGGSGNLTDAASGTANVIINAFRGHAERSALSPRGRLSDVCRPASAH